jgi:hypothetical protein
LRMLGATEVGLGHFAAVVTLLPGD